MTGRDWVIVVIIMAVGYVVGSVLITLARRLLR